MRALLLAAQDPEPETRKLPEVDLDAVPAVEGPEQDGDSLAAYSFPKFAATYFQKSASHTHVRKPLRYPLLYHEDDADCSVPQPLVSVAQGPPSLPPPPASALWFRAAGGAGPGPAARVPAGLCLPACRPPWLCGASS